MGFFDRTESSNPAFRKAEQSFSVVAGDSMTVQGAVNKSIALTLFMLGSALWAWNNPNSVHYVSIAAIAAFIVAIVTIFKMEWSPITAPIYAILEGVALGAISATYEAYFQGIAIQAVSVTIGVLLTMLIVYRTGLVKVDAKFKKIMFGIMGGLMFMIIINFIMGFFGASFFRGLEFSPMNIGISLILAGVAAFSLLLDFKSIEDLSQNNAPKYMEWYSGFSLLVTLVWLYLEVLRLLAIFANNRD